MTDVPTNTIILRGLPAMVEEKDVSTTQEYIYAALRFLGYSLL